MINEQHSVPNLFRDLTRLRERNQYLFLFIFCDESTKMLLILNNYTLFKCFHGCRKHKSANKLSLSILQFRKEETRFFLKNGLNKWQHVTLFQSKVE